MDTEESLLGFQQQDVTELCFGMYPCWCVDKYLCMQIDLETGLQVALVVKNLPARAGDVRDEGSIPRSEDPLEEGMATLSSILAWRIPMDRGAWQATVHRVSKSWRRLKRLSMHTHRIF